MVCRFVAALALSLCFCTALPHLSANDLLISDLSELLAQESFVTIDEETLERSRQSLLDALKSPAGEIDDDEWSYLRTDAVAEALENDSAELHDWLSNLVDKLNQDYSPYEEPRLLELRRLVRRHLAMIDNRSQAEQLRQSFQREKQGMQQALVAFAESGSGEHFGQLASGIRWMQDHDMAGDFVHAAKGRLSFPNFEARLPASLIQSVTSRTMPTQTETIDRTSDGIRTLGSGVFTSHAHLKPIAAIGQGDFRLRFEGEFRLSATNTRKKVRFRSNATTWATGIAAIGIDNAGYLSFDHLQVCANTDLRNGKACVDRRIGKHLVGRLVDRVVIKKTPEVEQTLSRELRERVQKELGTEIVDLVAKANVSVKDRFWSPANRLDLAPRLFSVATTNEDVQIRVLEDSQCGLAAPQTFSGSVSGSGYAAVHTSLLTDLMNSVYVRHKQPSELNGDLVQRLNASLPVQPLAEVDLPDSRLTFVLDFPRPFELAFEDDVVHLTMKAKRLVLDDATYPGRELTLSYRVSAQPDNHVLFELQNDPRLSASEDGDDRKQSELTQVVRDELLAGLLPAFTLDLHNLSDSDEPLPLQIARIASRQGWLVFSLNPQAERGATLAAQ